MAHTSRRRFGDDVGKAGSSGIAIDGVTEGARPAEGCADDLRVVAEFERAATRPGIVGVEFEAQLLKGKKHRGRASTDEDEGESGR